MSDWDPESYMKFQQEKTQPAIDLLKRVQDIPVVPEKILDVGCGPGNSTAVLQEAFPQADLLGIDSSPGMIERARREYPEIRFAVQKAEDISGEYDLLFSNACLQLIPNHRELIPNLIGCVKKGGVLAAHIPSNRKEPLFRIIRETVQEPRWGLQNVRPPHMAALEPEEYFQILAGCSENFGIWENVYYHELPSHRALIEWVRTARLRVYMDLLSEDEEAAFEQDLIRKLQDEYPVTDRGTVILRFRGLFFTARK